MTVRAQAEHADVEGDLAELGGVGLCRLGQGEPGRGRHRVDPFGRQAVDGQQLDGRLGIAIGESVATKRSSPHHNSMRPGSTGPEPRSEASLRWILVAIVPPVRHNCTTR